MTGPVVPVVAKLWYTSKTIWVGVVEFLIGVAGLLAPFFHAGVYTPEAITAMVAGALTIVLRLLTSTPLSFK